MRHRGGRHSSFSSVLSYIALGKEKESTVSQFKTCKSFFNPGRQSRRSLLPAPLKTKTDKHKHKRELLFCSKSQLEEDPKFQPRSFCVTPLPAHVLRFFCILWGTLVGTTLLQRGAPCSWKPAHGANRAQWRPCLLPPSQANAQASSRGGRPSRANLRACALQTWL